MNNILYLYENIMPTVEMIREDVEKTDRPGVSGRVVSLAEVTAGDLNEANVVIFIRPTDVLSWRLARQARKKGRFVITFCDDDLYNAPQDAVLEASRVSFFRKTIHISSALITCSPRIAEKYRDYTLERRSVVSHTAVEADKLKPYEANTGKVRIVYAGGADHSALFEQTIGPIVNKLLEKYGNIFSLTFVGVHPSTQSLDREIEVEYVPMMPLSQYRDYMRTHHFDIGLAPIRDDEFSKCKYFNKYLEYTMFGIMGIFTDSRPYTYVVRNGENGLLAGYDPEDWFEAIGMALEDEKLRRRCAENAQRQVADSFNEKAIEARTYAALPELDRYDVGQGEMIGQAALTLYKAEYRLRRAALYGLTAAGQVKKNGLRATADKIAAHFRYFRSFNAKER